ncbi:hypothetical protein Plec18167_006938 [Paecilomyces lecythidis]|uniref:BTB domain-containing protein n=1 Tax=Paecilomyces lecythidis TaxID=3004212 RepID=A0ABR3X791_9EURO
MADIAPDLLNHANTPRVPGPDIPHNGDIEMSARPSTSIDSCRGGNATVVGASWEEDKKFSFTDGNLILAVGSRHVRIFKTFSSLLASTSPIWNDIIVKAKMRDSGSLQLPNDDENSMLLFLQIVHLRFADLPKSISFEELHLLTRFCDKYQVRHLFLPFVLRWIVPFIHDGLNPADTEWLFISLVWEIDYILYPFLNHVFWNTRKDVNGRLSYAGHLLADLLPDAYSDTIMEHIELGRRYLLQQLIECCMRTVEYGSCSESEHYEECHMLTKGYLLTGFEDLGSWPLDPETTHLCPEDIKSAVLRLRYEPLPAPIGNDEDIGPDHSDCGVYMLKCQVSELNCDQVYARKSANTDLLGILPKDSAIRSAFLPYLPSWSRSGFYARDFEDINSASDDDIRYRQPHREDTEPLEEYLSESDPNVLNPDRLTYALENSSSDSDSDDDEDIDDDDDL